MKLFETKEFVLGAREEFDREVEDESGDKTEEEAPGRDESRAIGEEEEALRIGFADVKENAMKEPHLERIFAEEREREEEFFAVDAGIDFEDCPDEKCGAREVEMARDEAGGGGESHGDEGGEAAEKFVFGFDEVGELLEEIVLGD